VLKDQKKFGRDFKVYFRSTTPQEDHYHDYFIADDKLCADAGLDTLPSYHRIVYPARTTKWNSWRMGLRDYAQLLFRDVPV
jgi:enterochelin esterase family protein